MDDLLEKYKGDNSNFDCVKSEIENVLEQLDGVNRLKVNREFANDVLDKVKSIRLAILSITD